MSLGAEMGPLRWVPGVFSGLYVLMSGFLLAIAWWLPRLGREDVFFGVTVEPGFRDTEVGQGALRTYGRWVFGTGVPVLMAMLVVGFWWQRSQAFAVLPGLLFVQILGFLGGYFVARRRVLPASVNRHLDGSAMTAGSWVHDRLPGGLPGQAGPYALLAAAGVWLWNAWASIPERYPVHWNAALEPDAWSTRSAGKVFGPLLVGAVMVAALWVIQWGMLRFTRAVHETGEAAETEKLRRRRTAEVVLLAAWDMALIFALVALAPLFQTSPAASRGWLVSLLAVSILGTLAILVWIGLRLVPVFRQQKAGAAPPPGDGTPDVRWKGGLVYYAPDDPAIFIEKRFGLGYTVNMARPAVWWMLLLLIGAPLLLAFLF
jgi:hypothetical protein